MANYWSKVVRSRISRRRALTATGAGVFSAAFLAACGSDDEPAATGGGSTAPTGGGATGPTGGGATGPTGSTGPSTSSLITQPSDTTAQAKPGGVIKDFYSAELTHMDALLSNSASTVNLIAVFGYPRLMKFTLVGSDEVNDGTRTEGEVATGLEVSPDGLKVTMKLRKPMIWDRAAPTNGRQIDAQDVLFSFKKYSEVNPGAPYLASSAAPGAAVDSLEAPDDSTVVMNLNRPEPILPTLLAGWDVLYIMPRESDGGFDPKTELHGHGPWLLDEFAPSAHTHWKKNPDYYNAGRPFPDRLERALVPEYATRLAQFKAGNIHTFVAANQDIVQTKKDVPETVIYEDPLFGSMTSSPNIYFGYEGESVFRDTRMRQAMSMAIDRDAFAQVIENIDQFAADGIDIEWGYNSQLSPGWGEAWLDPSDSAKFGPAAKYLQFNPEEAKKLISAAGYANGAQFDFFHNAEATYGPAYGQTVEIYQALFADVGLNASLKGLPYNQWQPIYHYGYTPSKYLAGEVSGFNGIGLGAERTRYSPALSLFGIMHPEGDAFHGSVPKNGVGSAIEGDPELNQLLAKLRLEADRDAAISQAHDAQRYIAENANFIPKPSNSRPLRLMWPAIANAYVFNSSSVGRNLWAENYINWWLDSTKAPLA